MMLFERDSLLLIVLGFRKVNYWKEKSNSVSNILDVVVDSVVIS